METFVNFSNHPSAKWDEKQIKEAKAYGTIVDVPFPAVDPHLDEDGLEHMAEEYIDKIMEYTPKCVMAQGEFTLCYKVIRGLLTRGVTVVAACSQRNTVESGNTKVSVFEFVRFRRYE